MDINKIKSDLKDRIKRGISFGIQGLEEVLVKSSGIYNDFVLISSQYNELTNFARVKGTIPYDQFETGTNKIRNGLLLLIDEITQKDIETVELGTEIKDNSLSNRRENFFRLFDIHFKLLSAISVNQVHGYQVDELIDTGERIYGREAFFHMWKDLIYNLNYSAVHPYEDKTLLQVVNKEFLRFLESKSRGLLEVYFKNIMGSENGRNTWRG